MSLVEFRRGPSSYELAVAAGFKGDELDFLNHLLGDTAQIKLVSDRLDNQLQRVDGKLLKVTQFETREW